MAESKIIKSVGAPPASNLPQDVRTVQSLLRNVRPVLFVPVPVTGSIDNNTRSAISEYQKRFMAKPDGRIDPDGATLMRLNWEPVVDQDINTARQCLNIVIRRVGTSSDQAIANAYCYGWLATALQPGYRREAEEAISVPSPRR